MGKFFGNAYAVNTLGAIMGSFAAGFILIPWLGARNSLLIAVTLKILTAGLLFLRAPTPALPRRVLGAVVTAAIALVTWYLLAAWDAAILTSGPYLYAGAYKIFQPPRKWISRRPCRRGVKPSFSKRACTPSFPC